MKRQYAPHVVVLILCFFMTRLSAQDHYGSMPNGWADWSHVAVASKEGLNNALGGVVGQVVHQAMPNGGPQAFECYTYDDHAEGTTRLAFGCVSNVELAGAGKTAEIRGGGVLSGSGRVDYWRMNETSVDVTSSTGGSIGVLCALCPQFPAQGVDERRGVWIEDASASNLMAGGVTVPMVKFTNGWSLRAAKDSMELRDANGVVHVFK